MGQDRVFDHLPSPSLLESTSVCQQLASFVLLSGIFFQVYVVDLRIKFDEMLLVRMESSLES